jgi:RHH-type rel operon transcriptional repressor/antitoxin RelB
MAMTLTVRLDPELERQLARYCKKRRQTKTEVLTRLLREHLAAAGDTTKTPYQIAQEFGLVGAFASGKRDLAENRKQYLKEKLRAKHAR